MASVQTRRSATVLPALLLGAAALLLLASLTPESRSFVAVASANRGNARGRTAMRGFKEDFDAWKSSLTDEEKSMIQEQAEGEFNKKFRKSDEFKKDLPEEKMKSFSKILGKFFDAEAEDYKKEVEGKAPDYDGLLKKAAGGGIDFALKCSIVELNRDADRRYDFASFKIEEAQQKGELYPQSSPLQEIHAIQNNDTASHEYNLKILEFLKAAAKDPTCPPEAKAYIAEWEKKGIPAVGEPFELLLPQVMVNQVLYARKWMKEGLGYYSEGKSESEVADYVKEYVPKIGAKVIGTLAANYVKARDEIEEAVEKQKKFFRSQKEMPGKTKADVLKELWAELPKYSVVPVPPLDDEMLAELAQEPATEPGELLHTWGTADKLYKSEAIDHFGSRYLLGLFETKEEAAKAFVAWNDEYEVARKNVAEEMAQWNKREQAKVDADVVGQARIKEMLSGAS
mmetsp:Transcript_89770/g.199469  ORF Transcript_89770/g.199469 Transcript_89770/m.199469 type:complete len:455 (+) Transcript_89770:76-1440(+)